MSSNNLRPLSSYNRSVGSVFSPPSSGCKPDSMSFLISNPPVSERMSIICGASFAEPLGSAGIDLMAVTQQNSTAATLGNKKHVPTVVLYYVVQDLEHYSSSMIPGAPCTVRSKVCNPLAYSIRGKIDGDPFGSGSATTGFTRVKAAP